MFRSYSVKKDWIWEAMSQTVFFTIGFYSYNLHPWFARFVRDNPDEAVGFFKEQVRRLTTGPEPQARVRPSWASTRAADVS